MSDAAFLAALEACTLDPAAFKHAGHVRAAYLMLREGHLCGGDLAAALARFGAALRRFAAHHGQSGRYHETVTVAFLAVINERMRSDGDAGGWTAFAAAHPDLLDSRFLAHYYPRDVLASPLARRVFILPGFSPAPRDAA